MDISDKLLIEKITKIRQAYSKPNADLPTLKPFAMDVGVSEEEWTDMVEIFHDHVHKGSSFIDHKNWDDAIEELDIAYQLDPSHEDTLFMLATAYEQRWWEKRWTSDKKKGIKYGELCLEANPKNKKVAGIITNLKKAPFKFWIKPATQWKLAKYAILLFILGGSGWYYYTNQASINTWAMSFIQKETENKDTIGKKEAIILKTLIFKSGSAYIPESSKPELNTWVEKLKANPNLKIEIASYTDNSGISSQNLQISELRAKAVYDYFIAKGVNQQQLYYKGYGDSNPIFPNDSEENRAKNRRIELKEF